MKKFIFLAGLAIGFVVGSRTGRGPYESLERTAHRVAESPEVQRRATQAKETATKAAHDTASSVKEKAPEAAAKAQERMGRRADGLDEDARTVAEDSAGSAAAGGDAEVGEEDPLSS